MCFQRKNSHNLTHFRKKSMGVIAQKKNKGVEHWSNQRQVGKILARFFRGYKKRVEFFFNWAKHHQFSFFLKGRGEKSCFLRTLSQFMFTYWFKKWVEVSHQFLFHTHALWQKFVHLFATQGGKMQVHHNFFVVFKKSFFKREEEGKIIDASVLLSLDVKGV